MRAEPKQTRRKKIALAMLSLIAIFLFWGAIFLLAGRPMLEMVEDPSAFRDWVDAQGILGRVIFVGFIVLQVLVSVIPSEPMEIAAGYAFGMIEGTLLCLVGLAIGTAMLFLFVRRIGARALDFWISREKIESIPLIRNEKRLRRVIFLLYLIPGTPKDGISWVAPLTPIPLGEFILISTVARSLSVITSTVSGSALGEKNYITAIIAFLVTIMISAIGIVLYRLWQKRHRYRKGNKTE